MKDGRIKHIPMRELEKLTSMTRATINFYIKEGILPVPQKSAKNMAYYDEEFIGKLKLVEKMREADFTLNQIKKLINSGSGAINDFGVQVMEAVNQLMPYDMDDPPVSREQIRDLGFDDGLINNLTDIGIIVPSDASSNEFPAYSLTICRVIRYFVDFGIPLSVAAGIITKLKELADIEKNAFVDYIRKPMLEKGLSAEAQRAEVRKCIENINSLLPVLHLQLIKLPNETLLKSLER
jgi:DNA-binding transcriptional MerR regulator